MGEIKQRSQFIADKVNCTYWWWMFLDTKNPLNKVPDMQGYSKFQHMAEAINKEDVLMAKMEMLYKHGYIEKSTRIEIYRRVAPLPSLQNDKLVITLLPKDYIIPPKMVYPPRLNEFIQKFYKRVAKNESVEGLRPLPERTKVQSETDLFNVNNHNFTTYSSLYLWAEKQIADGRNQTMVQSFIDNYIEKYFSKPTSNQMNQLFNHFKK